MSDVMDDLDDFMALEEEDETSKLAKQPVLPSQLEQCRKGTWALTLGSALHSLSLGGGITEMLIRVGYIFDDQDWTAVSAIEGSEVAEKERAEAEEKYDSNLRFGRWYDEDHPTGERGFQLLGGLLSISEEQAREVMFCDFKLPIIATMCDWFRPKIEAVLEEMNEIKIGGMADLPCPKCHCESTGVRVSYEGQMVARAMHRENPSGSIKAYQMIEVMADSLGTITHAHHICPNPDCDYDEHIDLAEFEVLSPGKVFEDLDDL